MRFEPSASEKQARDGVLRALLEAIKAGSRIEFSRAGPYQATVGRYSYLFEGEDDLLHLSIEAIDQSPIDLEEAKLVASFVLGDMPSSLIWVKPGERSHHFYLGHDDLAAHLKL